MAKYIPPEKMTSQQIQDELTQAFLRWNEIAMNGCRDPSWPDGVNMNLVRNHIIYWYGLLEERETVEKQVSLFDAADTPNYQRPVPPKVPDNYMVAGCAYSDRLKGRYNHSLVWGRRGEYQA